MIYPTMNQKYEAGSVVGGGGGGGGEQGVLCITAEAFQGDGTVKRDETLQIEQRALDRLSAMSLLSQELLSTSPPSY